MKKEYPDISVLLTMKAERRRQLARLPIEEKIAIVNKWRRLTRQILKVKRTNESVSKQI
jgi:hypothetical protein